MKNSSDWLFLACLVSVAFLMMAIPHVLEH
jgi:hypothetical protein